MVEPLRQEKEKAGKHERIYLFILLVIVINRTVDLSSDLESSCIPLADCLLDTDLQEE